MVKNTKTNRDALLSLFTGGYDFDTISTAYPMMGQPLTMIAHKMNELVQSSKKARLSGQIDKAAVLETRQEELVNLGRIETM
jgi:hypothetical protein